MCFCISSYYDTAGKKNISWPQDKGGRGLNKLNKRMRHTFTTPPYALGFSCSCSLFTLGVCSRFWWAQSWQHQASRLVKPHLQPKYPSSSQRTWRPLPRMTSDPGNKLLCIYWRKKSNPFCCCEASVKPESVLLFLLTGTKQDPGILNVAFVQRGDTEAALEGCHPSCVLLWPHFANTAEKPPSQCWKVTAHFMPRVNFEQQSVTPDSSSFHSREMAHRPQPQKPAKL